MRQRPIVRMNAAFKRIRPAALSRQILAVTSELEVRALAKTTAPAKPVNSAWNPTFSGRLRRRNDPTYPEVFK